MKHTSVPENGKTPEVSVFLTSYNHGKYLRESIDSVLAQTYTDFELIIWDDASTDDSWEIIQSYTDPRIRAYRNEETKFGGMNYRNAVEHGLLRGAYVAMHHSDDAWLPEKLERQIDVLQSNPEFGAVFTDVLLIGEDSAPFQDTNHPYYGVFRSTNRNRHRWLRYFFRNGNTLCHPSAIIRKSILEKEALPRYGLPALGDLDIWIRVCMRHEIYIVQKKLTRFRVRYNNANASGNSIANHRKLHTNTFFLYEHYERIDDFSELQKIFPEVAQYWRREHTDVQFVFALYCLTHAPTVQAVLRAYMTIFNILQDEHRAKIIYEQYGFDYRLFAKMQGDVSIFYS